MIVRRRHTSRGRHLRRRRHISRGLHIRRRRHSVEDDILVKDDISVKKMTFEYRRYIIIEDDKSVLKKT